MRDTLYTHFAKILLDWSTRPCQILPICQCVDGALPRWSSTRSSAIAEGPRDASCQLKSCQLPRNSTETTYTTSPDQIDGLKLEI